MPTAPTDLSALLDAARDRTVLILGDLMLDHFVIGRVERISPEAPVPVVQFDHESYRLGGAANVAHNVAALGGRVEIAGLVGNDAEGARLVGELREAGIGTAGVLSDGSRCTTRKLRVVTTRNQQVARVDYECDTPAAAREVSDVTGAGDTVIATMALSLSARASLADAARLANKAAGLAVARFGPVAISRDELLTALG